MKKRVFKDEVTATLGIITFVSLFGLNAYLDCENCNLWLCGLVMLSIGINIYLVRKFGGID